MTHRQNRVLPTGDIVAIPDRGLFMGNRGILHDAEGRLGVARWKHPHWITCRLEFKGRKRNLMAPGSYTELFFLDEAVACAAGHRPCAECRRAEWLLFREAWVGLYGEMPAAAIDRSLHRARVERRAQRRHVAPVAEVPPGAMILLDGRAHLMREGAVQPFSPAGYGPLRDVPSGAVTVLTPEPMVAVMRAGWRPALHPSAL
ncbi:hypothetical protein C0V75_07160 [Tabrizicola sp. TH137]|uniref:hypothetical protein n=1 Tax=Tabrizicola sp. TH137 TaxID=2067452 RepID=UPI000C7BC383|nr:hypothetical protein [Tabrizicola sp. TH137]PLL13705.1 hypothetical protein C0V75_07160 [Tabrizicola sp. TH137]